MKTLSNLIAMLVSIPAVIVGMVIYLVFIVGLLVYESFKQADWFGED